MMCWKKILCLSLLLQICFLLFALTASAEIGRASCRERV